MGGSYPETAYGAILYLGPRHQAGIERVLIGARSGHTMPKPRQTTTEEEETAVLPRARAQAPAANVTPPGFFDDAQGRPYRPEVSRLLLQFLQDPKNVADRADIANRAR